MYSVLSARSSSVCSYDRLACQAMPFNYAVLPLCALLFTRELSGLNTFFVLPATPNTIYVSRDQDNVAACSINSDCVAILEATGYSAGGYQFFHCITGQDQQLYTRCGALRAPCCMLPKLVCLPAHAHTYGRT